MDGTLLGGNPKAIEIFTDTAIADLSTLSLARYANGSTSPSTSTLSGAAGAGEFFYLVGSSDTADFESLFGTGLNTQEIGAVTGNGDDVYELLSGGSTVDVYGVIGTDGSGESWEYTDSWAYRKNNMGPNDVFTESEWTFGGVNTLDGLDAGQQGAAVPFGSYVLGVPEPSTFTLAALGLTALGFVGWRRRRR
jgi:MYXO-CTERM domain-containing protein